MPLCCCSAPWLLLYLLVVVIPVAVEFPGFWCALVDVCPSCSAPLVLVCPRLLLCSLVAVAPSGRCSPSCCCTTPIVCPYCCAPWLMLCPLVDVWLPVSVVRPVVVVLPACCSCSTAIVPLLLCTLVDVMPPGAPGWCCAPGCCCTPGNCRAPCCCSCTTSVVPLLLCPLVRCWSLASVSVAYNTVGRCAPAPIVRYYRGS